MGGDGAHVGLEREPGLGGEASCSGVGESLVGERDAELDVGQAALADGDAGGCVEPKELIAAGGSGLEVGGRNKVAEAER